MSAVSRPSMFSLQWGHGGEAVESQTIQATWKPAVMLQWGHGGEAVESVHSSIHSTANCELQWGHGGEAVESRRAQGLATGDGRRFNGATAVKPWNLRDGGDPAPAEHASMGPRR